MEVIHRMLPEDEIFLCGLALLIGVALGFVTGLICSRRAGRAA